MKHFRECPLLDLTEDDNDEAEALALAETLHSDLAAHSVPDEYSDSNLTLARYQDRFYR